MSKLKLWDDHKTWEEADAAWEQGKTFAEEQKPLKKLKELPNIPGITPETARHLKWNSFKWMVTQDNRGAIRKGFFRHPLKYGWRLLKSLLKKKSFVRDEDFFLYGIHTIEEFKNLLTKPNSLLVIGFSYCHKPFECPAGRFTDGCIHDADHPVCRQCFIGKTVNTSEKNTIPLFIPTVHYIGEKIFDIVHANPKQEVIFLITACELTLEMFGDWGNMVGIKGIGVRLDGRICNTMKAFELSEQGIKPGLTIVREPTQKTILELMRIRREKAL